MLLLFLFVFMLMCNSDAAAITWGTPTKISNNGFSNPAGRFIWGGCGNCCTTAGCSVPVTIASKTLNFYPIWTGSNTGFGNNNVVYSPNSACTATSTPDSGLTGGLNTIATNFICDASPSPQIEVFGLVAGGKYTLQILGMDERSCCRTRTQYYGSTGGTDSTSFRMTDEDYVIGTFTADATSQVALIKGGQTENNINMVILRTEACLSGPTGYPNVGGNGFGGGTGCTITTDADYPQNAAAVCNLRCLNGYTASSTSWTCASDGSGIWSSATGNCSPNSCTSPPTGYPAQGNGFANSGSNGCVPTSNPAASQSSGSTCDLTCNSGYTAAGSYSCNLGVWTANGTPSCTSSAIPCTSTPPGYPAKASGFVSGSGCVADTNPANSQLSGSTCAISCQSGYTAQGSFTCTNGVWSPNSPSCTPSSCAYTPPGYPANSNGFSGGISCSTNSDPTAPQVSGATCSLACSNGYSPQGSFTCSQGNWAASNSPIPSCNAQACTTNPAAGIQSATGITSCTLGSVPSGSECGLACQSGFMSSGFTFTCTASQWSNTGANTPSCIAITVSSSAKAFSSSAQAPLSSSKATSSSSKAVSSSVAASSSAKAISSQPVSSSAKTMSSSATLPTSPGTPISSSTALTTGTSQSVAPSSSASSGPSPDDVSSASSSSPTPAIAGAVIGVVVVTALIVLFVRFRKKKQAQEDVKQIKKATDSNPADSPGVGATTSISVPLSFISVRSPTVTVEPESMEKESPLLAQTPISPKLATPNSRGTSTSISSRASPKASSPLSSSSPKSGSPLGSGVGSSPRNAGHFGSLEALLRSTSGLAAFKTFLVKELSVENLLFWLAVEDYRKRKRELCSTHKPNDKEVIVAMKPTAVKIFQTFISKTEVNNSNVNLPEDVDERVVKRLRTHFDQYLDQEFADPEKTIFDEAQETIFKLMESDSWKRFQRSAEFAQLKP